MTIENVTIFRRGDLIYSARNKPMSDVVYTDLAGSNDNYVNNSVVMFIDNNGQTKILKNRYGDGGVVGSLPNDVTKRDIKRLRNYFGEHDVTMFEHRAYDLLDSLLKHVEASEQ
tara:strand:+ start:104 stop:445 length:342 start_codon:yes stop_codon:yes gene_type:complete